MVDFPLTGQHHAGKLPQGTDSAEGGKQHGNQMIVGFKAFIVSVGSPGVCCPVNQSAVDKAKELFNDGMT